MKRSVSNRTVTVADLRSLHAERAGRIRERLAEFRAVPPSEYFYELVYCLLTPQSSAENAGQVVFSLRAADFASTGCDPEPHLGNRAHYIRFHRTKSRHLLEALTKRSEIHAAVVGTNSPDDLRDWLVKNVKGLGYKEATHFLRNIGRNDGLAILDRHILRNLKRFKVIRSIPDSLSKKRYLHIEALFQKFAHKIGIPLDELDLLFWSMETGEIRK